MRRAFVQGITVWGRTSRWSLSRNFVRQVKPVQKKFDLDKLAINEKAVVYKQEIMADRDFFYQEMLDLPSEEAILKFYNDKKDQMDGLGIKLLIEELLKRKTRGKIPNRKILKTLVHPEEVINYQHVTEILNSNSKELLSDLSNSYLVELIEIVSKYGLIADQFTIVVINRFLLRGDFSPSQWTYEFLLRCVKQDSEAYPIILEMLEEDLTTKRVEIKDPIVALSILDKTISFREEKMKLVRQLEYYLDITTNDKLTEELARHLVKVYSESRFRSANLDLLDKVAATLVPVIPKKGFVYLRPLLQDLAAIGLEDFTLLSAISRRLFDLLADKAVALDKLALENNDLNLSDGEEDGEEVPPEDEESLETITANLFGKNRIPDGNNTSLIGDKVVNQDSSSQNILLADEIAWLPEMLYNLVALNVKLFYQYFNDDIYKLVTVSSLQVLEQMKPKDLFYLTYCHSKFCFEKQMDIEKNKKLYYKRATKSVMYILLRQKTQ
jgi:hypothetical protein